MPAKFWEAIFLSSLIVASRLPHFFKKTLVYPNGLLPRGLGADTDLVARRLDLPDKRQAGAARLLFEGEQGVGVCVYSALFRFSTNRLNQDGQPLPVITSLPIHSQ